MIKIYNSLTNRLEDFKPIKKDEVSIYVCGPTVYNYIHIGNARPLVFFDVVRRYFTYLGYKTTFVSNITDVDDKIIKKAIEQGKTELEIAKLYEDEYFKDAKSLCCLYPTFVPKATEYIKSMIEYIQKLIDNGFAYKADGGVYFRVSKVKDYGILSNQDIDNLVDGVRKEVIKEKENPLDFTLWKETNEGIKWDSPFGMGRPGWHTECVVMNHSIFGDRLDIHGGGNDLKFPHHENEIAQHSCIYHNTLANYFMHVARLDINGNKMSKSLGNTILVKDFKDHDSLMTLKYILVFSNYRNSINYNDELYKQFNSIYLKHKRALIQTYYFLKVNDYKDDILIQDLINTFKTYMNDDFNLQNVLMLLDDIIKDINISFRQKNYDNLNELVNTFKNITQILGIDYKLVELTNELKDMYKKYLKYKEEKNFIEADKLKEELNKRNIL